MTDQIRDYYRQKCKDVPKSPATKKTFPCTIGLRTYQTEEEYLEALHDFLNGN